MTDFTTFRNCSYRIYKNGIRIGKDPGYPQYAWGHYLPGDEPGFYCNENDIKCDPGTVIDVLECPRIEMTNINCECCQEVKLYKDIITSNYFCIKCGYWFEFEKEDSDINPQFLNYIEEHINRTCKLKKDINRTQVLQITNLLYNTINNGNKILICGNGGSAADSQHFAAELVNKVILNNSKAYPAIALTTDTSTITAVGNDIGFDQIFSRQVEALAKENDVLIGFTTSGRSQNVINALELMKNIGGKTIVFRGLFPIKSFIPTIDIEVKSSMTSIVQEVHITIYHLISTFLENIIKD